MTAGYQSASDIMDCPENDETGEWLISCRCESANAITALLSCLNNISTSSTSRNNSDGSQFRNRTTKKKLQPVTVVCSPTGLTFHAHGKSKQIQASIDLQSSWFTEYNILQENTTNSENSDWQSKGQFCINLTTVLECLQVLGSSGSGAINSSNGLNNVKLFMAYNRIEEYFKIELLQEDISLLMTAAIPSIMSPDDVGNEEDEYESYDQSALTLAFRSSPIAARIIVKSDVLREVLSELEVASYGYSTTTVSVSLTKDYGLEFILFGGVLGNECWITVPTSGSHVVSIEFGPTAAIATGRINSDRVKRKKRQSYAVSGIIESLRVVNQLFAQETCLTINSEGMIAIQHQIVDSTISNVPSFIDFIMCCIEDPDDTEDDYVGREDSTIRQETSDVLLSSSNRQPVTQGDEDDFTSNYDTSRLQTPMSSERKSKRRNLQNFDEDSQTGSDSDGIDQPFSEAAKLFGTVVANGTGSARSSASASPTNNEKTIPNHLVSRNVRPRRQRNPSLLANFNKSTRTSILKNKGKSKLDDDDQSTSLLNENDGEVNSDGNDDESESEPLDITAPAIPPASPPYDRVQRRDNYDGESSSPELVYGRQN